MGDLSNPFWGKPHNPRVDELADLLRKVADGCLFKPTPDQKKYLGRARKILEREGIVFKTIVGAGIVRLAPSQIVSDDAERDRDIVRRRAKRSLKKLSAVEDSTLDAKGRRARDFSASVMGLISVSTDKKTLKKIGDAKKAPTIDQAGLVEFLTK